MSQQEGQGQKVQIKATDEKLAGTYANMMQVSHTKEEFVLDFVNILPPSGQLVSRILLSPAHAKRIMLALQENIQRYETQFTKIEGQASDKTGFGFKTE
jgi:hypothetical protein